MKTIYLGIIALISTSCTRIVFDTPQPADTQPLTAFPTKYQGSYMPEDDSPGILTISAHIVTIPDTRSKSFTLAELKNNPNIKMENGLLYDAELPELGGIPYTIQDSTLSYSYVSKLDTVGISDTLVIKEMGSMLIASLNTAEDSMDVWDVMVLELADNGDLITASVGNLKTPDSSGGGQYDGSIEDFAKIAPYKRLEEDTYLFSPDKHQFSKLVKKGLFSDRDTMPRMH